jgi:hypothetical protein
MMKITLEEKDELIGDLKKALVIANLALIGTMSLLAIVSIGITSIPGVELAPGVENHEVREVLKVIVPLTLGGMGIMNCLLWYFLNGVKK